MSPLDDTSRQFRDVMGRFATGVTVVTTASDDVTRAMTANAVSSLSLDPLLLLVCVQHSASIHDVLIDAGVFAVNILAGDQLELSQLFASRGEFDEPMGGVSYRSGQTGAPLLDGVLAWVDCEVHERLDGGDHSIFVGRAVDFSIARPDAPPLLFYGGGYFSLGDSA